MWIISCGGKFHAFAVAEALYKKEQLRKFYTTFYSKKDKLFSRLVSRVDKENIPVELVKTNVLPEVPFRLLKGKVGEKYGPYLKAVWFDRWVARNLKKEEGKVFMGWSSMSLESIEVAKEKGMIIVLTRGSSHINYQLRILQKEYEKRGFKFVEPYGIRERELTEYEIADYIQIPSLYVKRTFLEEGIPEKKLIHIPYGVNLSHFRPYPREDSEKFRVLFMTSLTIRKGVFYAMEVVEKFGNIKDIEFWFIGNIESKIKGLFLQFLKKFSNVKYLGFISHYELHKYISQCDVGVLPSIEEGLAMVIPQMMACGLPVIATVNTGAEDLIENGKEGFIVPIMDAEVIAERIEFLYNNRDVCNELRNNALKRVKSQTWDTFTKVLLSSV